MFGIGLIRTGFCFLILRAVFSCASCVADEPSKSRPRAIVESAVGREGRLLEAQVQIGKDRYSFLVDTGSSLTCFDPSLSKHLKPSTSQTVVRAHGGEIRLDVHECPRAMWGGLDLSQHATVVTTDLTQLRQASGRPIYGIIGMDALRHHVLRVDFEAGRLQLLAPETAPQKAWGPRMPLQLTPAHVPIVKLGVGQHTEHCVVDTGANGSTLASRFMDQLKPGEFRAFQHCGSIASAKGISESRSGRVATCVFAGSELNGLRFDESDLSLLGLNLLRRFQITLDFPGKAMYVVPNRRLNDPDQPATSGLSLLRIDGELTVVAVQPGSPANRAGVQDGDVIRQLDSVDASQLEQFEVGRLLTSEPGKRVVLSIVREQKEHRLRIELEERILADVEE